jgi:hypothetical protein
MRLVVSGRGSRNPTLWHRGQPMNVRGGEVSGMAARSDADGRQSSGRSGQ